MDNQISGEPRASWTWADMFLTYRFWGLLLFYLFSLASSGLVSAWLPLFLQESSSDATMLAGLLNYAVATSALLGFYVAWAATRRKAKTVLLVAGILLLVGGLLLTFDAITAIWLRFVGAVLFGLGAGAITLGVPAILAGGRGGAQAFVIAFGLLFTFTRVSDSSLTLLVGSLWDHYGSSTLAAIMAVLAILGLLALLPANPELFTRPPRARTYSWAVGPRSPVLVALGSVITPIYYYLWYKFHGEVASLRPSSKVLSPWGAVFILLSVELACSVVLAVFLVATWGGRATIYCCRQSTSC